MLTQKSDKDTTRIEYYKPVFLMNIDVKILKKILANQMQYYIKKDYSPWRGEIYSSDAKINQCVPPHWQKEGKKMMQKKTDKISHLFIIKKKSQWIITGFLHNKSYV